MSQVQPASKSIRSHFKSQAWKVCNSLWPPSIWMPNKPHQQNNAVCQWTKIPGILTTSHWWMALWQIGWCLRKVTFVAVFIFLKDHLLFKIDPSIKVRNKFLGIIVAPSEKFTLCMTGLQITWIICPTYRAFVLQNICQLVDLLGLFLFDINLLMI